MAATTDQRGRGSMHAVRRLGIQLLKQGASQADVARELGVSRTSASNWAAASEDDSTAGGIPPPALAPGEMARVREVIGGGALAYGFPTDSWTIARLAIMLDWEFDLVCSTLHVFRMLEPALPWAARGRKVANPSAISYSSCQVRSSQYLF